MAHDREILGALCGRQEIIDEYKLTAKHFTNQKAKRMFDLLNKIHQTGKDLNDSIIMEYQKSYEDLCYGDFVDLPQEAHLNVDYYIERQTETILKEMARRAGLMLTEYSQSKSVDGIKEFLEKTLTSLNLSGSDRMVNISDAIYPAIERIQKYYESKGAISGITSGFKSVDEITGGFQNGDLIILGARASLGKTAMALSMATR